MKTNQEQLRSNDAGDKQLYRRLFEIQIELGKFADNTSEFREETKEVIRTIDQLFQKIINE